MEIFEANTEIYVGDKFDEVINKIKCKKAFIVTDSVMTKIGMTKKFENIFEQKNIEYKIFDEVEVDPSFEIVNKALDKVIDFLPEVIIAIGGGSSLDTAKAIKYFVKKSNLSIPLIALPTTSGTGSEVTSYAVLTDKKNNIKIPLKDNEMIPEYAILDPELTKTLPKSVVADSGIDALTHAIESYTCKGANFYTQIYALSAIRLIFKNLLRMYKDIKDDEARIEMAKASYIAGFAFEKSGLGINHSIAHAIGGKFHIAHGKINGTILPYVIRFNSEDKTTALKYYEISKDLGFPANSIEEGAESLAVAVEILNKNLGLPSCVKDLAIDEEKYKNEIEIMTKSALEDICTSGNIREVNLKNLKELFVKVYG
ncbi:MULTISPECIES: 1-propanol dehydrogenase PduQ [Fusobacterium]|uniref:1-propanol dehydrogenase PduQ n=1 Tax=Fusobacterium TaxID=848 RepID=UPI0004070AAD|nr:MULTISPECIES: 1-propanol dehydrogenase PduQ [Fusobacterium]